MSDASTPNEWELLFAGYFDGRIDAAQLQQLESLIRRDETALRRFVEYGEVCAQLAWEVQARHSAVAAVVGSARRSSPPGNKLPLRIWAYAAMIVCGVSLGMSVLLTYAWNRHERMTQAVRHFATLIDARDAVFERSDVPTSPGSQLPGGFMRLKSGEVDIEFFSGAEVTVTGPAIFGVNSEMRGYLERGKAAAYCPPSAKGFTIGAPGLSVIDLGTRFTLRVSDTGQARVEVHDGLVQLLSDTGRTQQVHGGSVAEHDTGGAIKIKEMPDRHYQRQLEAASPVAYWPMHGVADPAGRMEAGAADTSDWISTGNTKLIPAREDFTISLWVRTTLPGQFHLVSNNLVQPGRANIGIVDGYARWFVGLKPQLHLGSKRRVDDGRWHQVVLTRAGGEYRLYVDGEFEAAQASDEPIDQTHEWHLGGAAYHNFIHEGDLAHVAIFDRALPDTEIRQHHRWLMSSTSQEYREPVNLR